MSTCREPAPNANEGRNCRRAGDPWFKGHSSVRHPKVPRRTAWSGRRRVERDEQAEGFDGCLMDMHRAAVCLTSLRSQAAQCAGCLMGVFRIRVCVIGSGFAHSFNRCGAVPGFTREYIRKRAPGPGCYGLATSPRLAPRLCAGGSPCSGGLKLKANQTLTARDGCRTL